MTATAQTHSDTRIQTLCFHGIGRPDRQLEPGEERFWISESQFEEIVAAVVRHPRRVHLTFDDGNESDHTFALPVLVAAGLRAAFFIITDRLDAHGSLSSAQLGDLHAAGMTIGTHGMSHRPWPLLAADGTLDSELSGSARRLEEITSENVHCAALPQGRYDRRVLSRLKRLGYSRVYSVDEGWSRSSSWLRSRYSVYNEDTGTTVGALLDNPNLTAGRFPVREIKRAVKRWR